MTAIRGPGIRSIPFFAQWSGSAVAAVLAPFLMQVAAVLTPVVASFYAVRDHTGRAHDSRGARDRVADDGSSSHSSGS